MKRLITNQFKFFMKYMLERVLLGKLNSQKMKLTSTNVKTTFCQNKLHHHNLKESTL